MYIDSHTSTRGIMNFKSPTGALENHKGRLESQGLCDSQLQGDGEDLLGLKNALQGGHSTYIKRGIVAQRFKWKTLIHEVEGHGKAYELREVA